MLQHEIGTHVVTYYNGKAQPLELFSIGVPGYEELQEGLAVLAEYLNDGLTNSRMRTLAARRGRTRNGKWKIFC
ncbi:flavohemoglobin expression-modulating QEGLA motif protein [Niabella ginsengisoli]|uniref:Flavohemoglobin expression-modulating QEGLA motif protein n=1 Tax=Niabella ginsengisoli TaxID=522298 RepID=A0ABS9SLX8_9BACT|nr:tyrosine/phenylalanine carboxypeptidase domain-containing protein [Niabella ginsengisoli]MCH5599357.1 flavohemoglobin expression-modulating QEGLA motif protein [Niabella ginsengisoli]